MGEERRWEAQNRDIFDRGRGGFQAGGPRNYREEEEANKRRAMENRRADPGVQDRGAPNQGNQQIPMRERLGVGRNQGGIGDDRGRGRGITLENRGSTQAGICFWCRQEGHHQADCTNPPFCFHCKESGHIAAKCPTSQGATMHMYGLGFPGQGYHCLKIPGFTRQQTTEHQGLITVEKGGMSEAKMEAELKHLIEEHWQWKVKNVSEKEFLAVFPSKQMLEVFSKSKGFTMALYNTWATVTPSTRDPAASSVLRTGWIKLLNVPDQARTVDAVTLIGELAGEVVVVDELSLLKEDPIRVKIKAREIEKIHGFVEVFIEGVGYDIKFIPEMPPTKAQAPKDPPLGHLGGGAGDDDEDDMLYSDDEPPRRGSKEHKGDKTDGQQSKGSGYNSKQKSGLSPQQAKPIEGAPDGINEENENSKPLAVFDPSTNQFVDVESFLKHAEDIHSQHSSRRSEEGKDKSHRLKVAETDLITVQCEGGKSRLMRRDLWPVLKLAEEMNNTNKDQEILFSQESLGLGEVDQEGDDGITMLEGGEDRNELMHTGDEESEEKEDKSGSECGRWEQTRSARQKAIKKRKFFPVVAARKSSRSKGVLTNTNMGDMLEKTEMEGVA